MVGLSNRSRVNKSRFGLPTLSLTIDITLKAGKKRAFEIRSTYSFAQHESVDYRFEWADWF
jgi:hypothetical protein